MKQIWNLKIQHYCKIVINFSEGFTLGDHTNDIFSQKSFSWTRSRIIKIAIVTPNESFSLIYVTLFLDFIWMQLILLLFNSWTRIKITVIFYFWQAGQRVDKISFVWTSLFEWSFNRRGDYMISVDRDEILSRFAGIPAVL